jgi:hypothetical protein
MIETTATIVKTTFKSFIIDPSLLSSIKKEGSKKDSTQSYK